MRSLNSVCVNLRISVKLGSFNSFEVLDQANYRYELQGEHQTVLDYFKLAVFFIINLFQIGVVIKYMFITGRYSK